MTSTRFAAVSGIVGLILLLWGSTLGLTQAPPERHMGDVSRILFVHVPAAWNGMLVCTFAGIAAAISLFSGRPVWDRIMTGCVEVGTLLCGLILATGMIFARPTWGVWWTWDVRLTTMLLAFMLFAGVLALRGFIQDPERRATWSAVATIFAWVDIPIVYYCVRWWRSLHQIQSSPDTVDGGIVLPMRINGFAVLFIALAFIALRAAIEHRKEAREHAPEPAAITPLEATS